jgi:hypothetical protein
VEQLGARRDMRQTWVIAIALLAAIFLAGMPVVDAATRNVKVKGAVKVKDSTGDNLDSRDIGELGELGAPGSSGALAVRTFGGGGGFLGSRACGAGTLEIPARPNNPTIITGIIMGGVGSLAIDAPDLGPIVQHPVVTLETNASHPNEFVGLGNGLTVTPSSLTFTCTGTGSFVVLGQ